ncbi:enoyl-CoA hydratase-related protein [Oryzicola mucosus]|nr:enoyl-CoA hydratase-related protein [Oryzicola mucosus]
MKYKMVLVDRKDKVVTVTLNRPERMNATTWRLNAELRHAITVADADEGVRAVVVTGAGKHFCAGADLSGAGFARHDEEAEERHRITSELVPPGSKPFWEMNTPIVTAINGTAVGVGITMPLHFDIRIVAQDARIGFLFTRRGVIPEWNSPWLLPKLIGASRAMELMLTGRMFSGTDAVNYGIASQALPADQVLACAQDLAAEMARTTSAISVGITKRLIYQGIQRDDVDHLHQRTSDLFRWSTRQLDGKEGAMAFKEKRPPLFPMHKNRDFPAVF